MTEAQPETPVVTPSGTNSGIKARIKSVLIFLPFVLALLWFGGFAFVLGMAALAAGAGFEWARMVTKGQPKPKPISMLVATLCAVTVIASFVAFPISLFLFTLSLAFLLFAACYVQARTNVRLLCFGMIYIGLSISAMVWLRQGSSMQGLYDMATLLFIVWASDTFAYFTGRAIGGPKLAPKISPKKTWAGFIGSSLGAGLIGYFFALPAVTEALQVSTAFSPVCYAVVGAVLGMVGQAGDLSISYFKRKFDVKDTGALIPGHGGILDRIDALMLVALVFWFTVKGFG